MDIKAEFEQVVEGMEWGEVVSTLQAVIHDLLTNASNPPSHPPPPTPPPPVPAGLEFNTLSQPAASQGGGYSGCMPLGAAPPMMAAPNTYHAPLYQGDLMQPGHLHSQSAYSQGQYNKPAVSRPNAINQNLRPVGVLNGEVLYEMPADVFAPNVFAVPKISNTSNLKKKRKHVGQQAEDRPYVKKPPNAFLLYMKEQRPNVAFEISIRGSAAVNAHLGEKWKSLTKQQQAKYFDQADKERRLHEQLHPGWTGRENYGKKRKRQRRKAPTGAEGEMEAPYTLTQWMLHSNTVPDMRHLPNVCQVSPASWLDVAFQ